MIERGLHSFFLWVEASSPSPIRGGGGTLVRQDNVGAILQAVMPSGIFIAGFDDDYQVDIKNKLDGQPFSCVMFFVHGGPERERFFRLTSAQRASSGLR